MRYTQRFVLRVRCTARGAQAAQLAECYWMALARDVPFTDYAAAEVTVAAAGETRQCVRQRQSPTNQIINYTIR